MSSWEHPYNASTLPIAQSLNLAPVPAMHRGNLNHNSVNLGPPPPSSAIPPAHQQHSLHHHGHTPSPAYGLSTPSQLSHPHQTLSPPPPYQHSLAHPSQHQQPLQSSVPLPPISSGSAILPPAHAQHHPQIGSSLPPLHHHPSQQTISQAIPPPVGHLVAVTAGPSPSVSHPHPLAVQPHPHSLHHVPPQSTPIHGQHLHGPSPTTLPSGPTLAHVQPHPHSIPPQTSPYGLKQTGSPNAVAGPLTPTPVPHTPQVLGSVFMPHGAPAINPFSNGPGGQENDLPPELWTLGWRKFWSKRENRWYFWNCTTGDSLWEVPPMPGRTHPPGHAPVGHHVYDPLTDPLGIQCGVPPAGILGVKRRVSSGESLGSPSVKKFILAGPWDLEITSNVFVADSPIPQKHLLPPHPEIELLRAQLVGKLRQCYQTACHSRESIDAPKESLNRWFMEQKITDIKGVDPIFPSCENPEGSVSNSLLKEIMNDIPIKVVKSRYTGDARKQLSKYAEACKRTVETRNTSCDEARKVVKWKVEETFTWLRATPNASYEALQERLAHLKVTCQPHVHAAAKSSVEGICKKISVFAKQYSQQVRETHLKLFVDPQNVKIEAESEKGRFRCAPIQCGPYVFTEAGRLPTIEYMQTDRDHALLKFKTDAVRISTQYLQKLEQLYRYNCVEDRKFEFFLVRSFCLLKRYNTFCEDFSSPQNSQGSLPVPVMESIQRNFGVTFECFASPFNCYFRQYCSAFADTDGYFGSRGSFFGLQPTSGSFEMNPPFSEELFESAVTYAEELLGGTREPLSFIIFLPELTDDKDDAGASLGDVECSWLKKLENSRWKRKQITIPAFEHEFRHGALHNVAKNEVNIRSSHATVVTWLQNDAGFEEWKPTDQKVDALIDAYRPGRERERDRQELLAPERQNPHQADKAVAAAAAGATVIST